MHGGALNGQYYYLLMIGMLPVSCLLYVALARRFKWESLCESLKQAGITISSIVVSSALTSVLVSQQDGDSEFHDVPLLFWGVGLTATIAAQCDRILAADAKLRGRLLRNKFSGRLLDAECSSEIDKRNIETELLQSGKGPEVEEAVQVLIRMHLLTPELQRAAKLVGQLGDVSNYSQLWLVLGLLTWFVLPTLFKATEWLRQDVTSVVMQVQFFVFAQLFCCLPQDRRCFAAVTLRFWMLEVFTLHFYPVYCLLGAIVIGPPTVRFLIGGGLGLGCCKRADQEPPRALAELPDIKVEWATVSV
ncbi:unnamed protein product [Symbiodinium natans]|uniref:Uncharacterized protein n=1 Tax=Symbiodinium natans TaxID=878477 RepID=A0A812PXV1_9DINO|nr:unnamed protein product [Symbiodinium natans]